VKAAEIKTQMDLQAWLEGQSQEVCVWIAARAFAQRLPLYWSETALEVGKGQDNVELLTFYRSLLTALTFTHAKNDALKTRLGSAATQVTTVANPAAKDVVGVLSRALIDAFFVAQATAVASEAAENASAVAKTRAFVDAQWAEAEGVTEARRLWVEEMPDYTMAALRAMLDALPEPADDQPDYRSFWVPWYQGLLDGKPAFPQALTEAVALIPEDDWEQGDLHINNTVIPRLMEKYRSNARSDLSQAYPVDFTFDSLQRVMRMVGIQDDMAHLRDPAVVQSFLDDCDELRDTLQDFSDYAQAGQAGSNKIAMLHLSADKVLAELQRTRDTDHLRARHIVRLAGRLEAFSKEEGAREDMGEALSEILDDGIGLLRTVTRRHFGPAYTALAPLGQLTLDHVDQDEVVALFDKVIAQLEALPSDDLVALDEDGLNVFRDMIRELHEFRAAIAEASSDAFREVLEQRFAESIGGTGLAFGRFMEMSSSAAGKSGRAVDGAVKTYKRVQSFGDIIEFIRDFLNLGSPP
jgi:hypothetical protein